MAHLLGSFVSQPAGAASEKPADLSADVSNFLNWLPPDSETLTVYRSFSLPPPVGDLGRSQKQTKKDSQKFAEKLTLNAWYGYSVLPLHYIANRQLYYSLVDEKILLAIEGSRNSRRPEGEAGYRYDGCHIVKFATTINSKFLAGLRTIPSEHISVEGFPVAVCDALWGQETIPIYIVVAKPDLLFIATDKEYLTVMLKRLKSSELGPSRTEQDSAFTNSLTEWKYVDAHQSIWAIRHFQKPCADDQSPFYRPADNCAKGHYQDPDAVGIVVQYDGRNPSSFVFKYISAAKQLPWPGLKKGVADTAFSHSGICWTIRSGALPIDDKFFMAIGLLGHAMIGM